MNLRRFFHRRRRNEELTQEIAEFLDRERDENLARGMSAEDADRHARIKLGSTRRVHEDVWQQNSIAFVEGLLRDLKYATRALARSPGFTLTVVLVMALGIGANTAVFSLMRAVLYRGLPVADPDRLYYLNVNSLPPGATVSGDAMTSFSYPVYTALHASPAFAELMAYVPLSFGGKTAVRFGNDPQEAVGDMVSGNYLSGLGVRMAAGRAFRKSDEEQHTSVLVLSYNYWSRRFSRAGDILGKTLFVNGTPLTVIGVTARGFEGTEPAKSVDFWIPLQSRPEFNAWGFPATEGTTYLHRDDWWCLRLIARLPPTRTAHQAAAQALGALRAVAYRGLSPSHKGDPGPRLSLLAARGFPYYKTYYGTPLRVLMAMVSLVLLIALSNVAMLLLARNARRSREFSLRLSLGAGAAQILRQLLSEGLLLVSGGGVLAWLFAHLGVRVLAHWAAIDSSPAPDGSTLTLTLLLLAATVLLFAFAPLRASLASGVMLTQKSLGPRSLHSKDRAARTAITVQVAFCVSLLVGAGLLVSSLHNLHRVALGLRAQNVLVFGLKPQAANTPAQRLAFYKQVLSSLRVLPGVLEVSLAENRLGGGDANNSDGYSVDGQDNRDDPMVRENTVGPDFFHTLGVPLLEGRDILDSDSAAAPRIAVINRTFANSFLHGRTALGHTVNPGPLGAQIVGVVADHKYTSIDEPAMPMIWFPYMQRPDVGEMQVALRTAADPFASLSAIQRALRRIDPNVPMFKPMLQQAQFEESIGQQILLARLSECFGGLAVLLVATGIYGTLAYRVSRRTAEIGVRMALGAQRTQVVWMVLRGSLWLTFLGVVAGIPLAVLISRTLASALYNVPPLDAASYIVAVLGLVLVALIASAIPAMRAARLDPAKALRAE